MEASDAVTNPAPIILRDVKMYVFTFVGYLAIAAATDYNLVTQGVLTVAQPR